MTPQWYEDNAVYAERTACVWTTRQVQIMLVSMWKPLASQRVPDLVLSYVFMRNAEAHLSSRTQQHTRAIAAPRRGMSATAWPDCLCCHEGVSHLCMPTSQ